MMSIKVFKKLKGKKKEKEKVFKSILMNIVQPELEQWKGAIAHLANCHSGDSPRLFKAGRN